MTLGAANQRVESRLPKKAVHKNDAIVATEKTVSHVLPLRVVFPPDYVKVRQVIEGMEQRGAARGEKTLSLQP